MMNAREYLDVVDENGQPTGQIISRDDAHTDGILHRTVTGWTAQICQHEIDHLNGIII